MANKPYKPTLYDKYDAKRSWLIDTAETPEQQKKLKQDLKNLREQYLKDKAKGTQAGHAVTSGTSTTKPLTPAEKQAKAKRPAVGTDKAAAEEYGSKSWNNGYTN